MLLKGAGGAYPFTHVGAHRAAQYCVLAVRLSRVSALLD